MISVKVNILRLGFYILVCNLLLNINIIVRNGKIGRNLSEFENEISINNQNQSGSIKKRAGTRRLKRSQPYTIPTGKTNEVKNVESLENQIDNTKINIDHNEIEEPKQKASSSIADIKILVEDNEKILRYDAKEDCNKLCDLKNKTWSNTEEPLAHSNSMSDTNGLFNTGCNSNIPALTIKPNFEEFSEWLYDELNESKIPWIDHILEEENNTDINETTSTEDPPNVSRLSDSSTVELKNLCKIDVEVNSVTHVNNEENQEDIQESTMHIIPSIKEVLTNENKINIFFKDISKYINLIFSRTKLVSNEKEEYLLQCERSIKELIKRSGKRYSFQKNKNKDKNSILNSFCCNLHIFNKYFQSQDSMKDFLELLDSLIFSEMFLLQLGAYSKCRLTIEYNFFKNNFMKIIYNKSLSDDIDKLHLSTKFFYDQLYIFSKVPTQERSFIKSKEYLQIMFNICNTTYLEYGEFVDKTMTNIINYISDLIQIYSKNQRSYSYLRSIKTYSLLHNNLINELVDFMRHMNKLQEYIKNIQNQIKEKIRNNFDNPKLLPLYIYYRVGGLIIQRLLFSSTDEKEKTNCIISLKKFLFLCEKSPYMTKPIVAIDEFMEKDRSVLLVNDSVLYYIMLYIYLNIPKIFLQYIEEDLLTLYNILNDESTKLQLHDDSHVLTEMRNVVLKVQKSFEQLYFILSDIHNKRNSIKQCFSLYSIAELIEEIEKKLADNIKLNPLFLETEEGSKMGKLLCHCLVDLYREGYSKIDLK